MSEERKREDLRNYYKISFPDLKDIVWKANWKLQEDGNFSDSWLRKKFREKTKGEELER